MGKVYKEKDEVLSIMNLDFDTLYKNPNINYRSHVVECGNKIKITELLAREILKNKHKFGIDTNKYKQKFDDNVARKTYFCDHQYMAIENDEQAKYERRIVRAMIGQGNRNQSNDGLGIFIDYQTPLKSSSKNEGLGEIDLLAWNENKRHLTMIEFKRPTSDETLLRAVLEIYTYSKIVDKEILVESFTKEGNFWTTDKKPDFNNIKKAVLVYENSQPHKDFKNKENNHIKELMKEFEIDLYIIENKDNLLTKEFIENQVIRKVFAHDA